MDEGRPRRVEHYLTAGGVDPYRVWEKGIDGSLRGRITARITRIEVSGNFGDWKSVGDGVFELRIDVGPGYRVYFAEDGALDQIILLGGGDKDSQAADILKAKENWEDYNA